MHRQDDSACEVTPMRKDWLPVIGLARLLSGRAPDGGDLTMPVNPIDWHVFAALLLLFLGAYISLVPFTTTNWPLTGDEPHYLAMAASIAEDRDLDLANNSANCAVDPHVLVQESGEWRPAHMVGLPVLLALPYAVAGRAGAAGAMALISALTVALTYLLTWQTTGRRNTSLITAIALGVTPPFSVYTAKIYPEMPGALLLVLSLFALYRAKDKVRPYVVVGLAAAAMPWFVIRFAPLSVVLAVLAVARAVDGRHRMRNIVAMLFPCVVSAALYLAYNQYMYGSWSPLAVYGTSDPGVSNRTVFIYKWLRSLFGWLLDQRGGLFIYAPVFVFGVGGLAHLLSRPGAGRSPIAISLALGVLFGIVLPGYWVQWSPPTRYLVVVLPLLAMGIGHVVCASRSEVVRAALVSTTVVSIALGAAEFARPWLAYNSPFSVSELYSALPRIGSVSPTALLPMFDSSKTFKDRRHSGPLGARAPGSVELYFPGVEGVAARSGHVVRDPAASHGYSTEFGSDDVYGSGSLVAEVGRLAAEGRYTVVVRLRTDTTGQTGPTDASVKLSLASGAGDSSALSFAMIELPEDQFAPYYQTFQLEYYNAEPQALAARVEYAGTTPVWVDRITIVHTPPLWRSWGMTLAWAVLVGFLAYITYRSMRDYRVESHPGTVFPALYGSVCAAGLAVSLLAFGRSPGAGAWRFDGEMMRRQIGNVRFDRSAETFLAVGTHDTGFLVYGPYVCVSPGSYIATFRMRAVGSGVEDSVIGTVQATAGGGNNILASIDLARSALELPGYEDITLNFDLVDEAPLELRVSTTGLADVWLDYVEFRRTDAGAGG